MATLPTPGGDTGTWGTELNDFLVGTGDNVAHYANGTAFHQGVLHGTAAAPVTVGSGPTFKVARTEAVTEASMPTGNGSNNQGNAAVWAASKGLATSEAQAVGIIATASTLSTQSAHNDDACAINAQGAIQGAGTGFAMGGYFEGRRDTDTGSSYGIEVACRNWTATNVFYAPANPSRTMGIWLVNRAGNGATQNGVGLSFGNPDSVKWDVGIGFTSQNGGPIVSASLRDDSSAATSILINGTHATAAIAIAADAGPICIGRTTVSIAGTMLEVSHPDATSDPCVVFGRTSGTARDMAIQWRTGGSTNVGSKLFMVATPNGYLTGTATGDTGIQVGASGKMFHLGGTTKVITVTQANTLGFFAATPVAKPTVTGSRGANAALADLLTELATLGLITDSSSA